VQRLLVDSFFIFSHNSSSSRLQTPPLQTQSNRRFKRRDEVHAFGFLIPEQQDKRRHEMASG
jgi:hypothetical protein